MRSELFGRWLPLLTAGYPAYEISAWELVSSGVGPAMIGGIAVAALYLFTSNTEREARPLLEVLLLSTLLGAFSYFFQAKGWYYHAYPAFGCMLLLVCFTAASRSSTVVKRDRFPLATFASAMLALALMTFAFENAERVRRGARLLAALIVANTETSDRVAFIDTAVAVVVDSVAAGFEGCGVDTTIAGVLTVYTQRTRQSCI